MRFNNAFYKLIVDKLLEYNKKSKGEFLKKIEVNSNFFVVTKSDKKVAIQELQKICDYFNIKITTILYFCDSSRFTSEQIKELDGQKIYEFDKNSESNSNSNRSTNSISNESDLNSAETTKQNLFKVDLALFAEKKQQAKEQLQQQEQQQKSIFSIRECIEKNRGDARQVFIALFFKNDKIIKDVLASEQEKRKASKLKKIYSLCINSHERLFRCYEEIERLTNERDSILDLVDEIENSEA